MSNSAWHIFQEQIMKHFKTLGCDAQTNVTLKGIRTNHDIDVLVQTKFLGHQLKWLVEAKKWNKRISKLHVLALRQIVDDIGADKGFIISEIGFQKGAIEATKNSNIQLLSFDELKELTNFTVQNAILDNYMDRINLVVSRYFAHSKKSREKYDLKSGIENIGYFSAYILLIRIVQTIKAAQKSEYPIDGTSLMNEQFGSKIIEDFNQLINWLNLNLLVIDERILKAEILMQKNNDFSPELYFEETDANIHMDLLKKM